jgi:hypothetical protein
MKKNERKNWGKKKLQKKIGNCVRDATIIAHQKLACVC